MLYAQASRVQVLWRPDHKGAVPSISSVDECKLLMLPLFKFDKIGTLQLILERLCPILNVYFCLNNRIAVTMWGLTLPWSWIKDWWCSDFHWNTWVYSAWQLMTHWKKGEHKSKPSFMQTYQKEGITSNKIHP